MPELNLAWQKRFVFLFGLTPLKLWNFGQRTLAYVLKRKTAWGTPIHLKVDVSPACQLRCPVCLHGEISSSERAAIPKGMTLPLFQQLVDEVAGRTMAMSLYNLGEPLLNTRLPEMAAYAAKRGINTYLTSNLSLRLSEDRLAALIAAPLTMLVVAIDGVSNETFGRQRVRGDWSLVKGNLERLLAARRAAGSRFPYVSVQFIAFDFNAHERDAAIAFCREIGVDQLTFIRGRTSPWTESFAPRTEGKPLRAKALPRCGWPYFSALVNSDGGIAPCCNYRMRENTFQRATAPLFGDLRLASLKSILDGPAARTARGIVANPVRAAKETPGNYCDGCGKVAR